MPKLIKTYIVRVVIISLFDFITTTKNKNKQTPKLDAYLGFYLNLQNVLLNLNEYKVK